MEIQTTPADEPQELVRCYVCDGDAFELVKVAEDRLFAQPGQYRIVRCAACGLQLVNPRPTLAALGRHYPDEYFIYQKPEDSAAFLRPLLAKLVHDQWKHYIERFERVRGKFTPETRVLDVGCGLNDHLAMLQELRGCVGLGVDFKPEIAAYVRETRGMPVHAGTLQSAGLAEASFDVITMNEYLEHEPMPRDVLTEARRVIKPGGHLAIEIPHIDGFAAKLFGARWSQVDVPRHLVYFNAKTLAELLKRTGFRLIHTETSKIPGLIGVSVMQALGARRLGKMSTLDITLSALAGAPLLPLYPWLDEFMFAVAVAE
jgi:2-polyprenyl-3-methyl-5-hydroxy-6-metoxy-1,4-benzoquinol methylase